MWYYSYREKRNQQKEKKMPSKIQIINALKAHPSLQSSYDRSTLRKACADVAKDFNLTTSSIIEVGETTIGWAMEVGTII